MRLNYTIIPSQVVVMRTSQPLVGQNQRRSRDDERLLAAILLHQQQNISRANTANSGLHMRRSKGYIIGTVDDRVLHKDSLILSIFYHFYQRARTYMSSFVTLLEVGNEIS